MEVSGENLPFFKPNPNFIYFYFPLISKSAIIISKNANRKCNIACL